MGMGLCAKLWQRFFCVRVCVFFCLSLIVSSAGSSANAGEITLLTPKIKSVVYARAPSTHFVLKVSEKKDVDRLELVSKSGKVSPLAIIKKNKNFFVHFSVPLTPGMNHFTVSPPGQKVTIEYKPLRTLLNVNFDASSVYLYHRRDLMQPECRQCHDVNSVPDDYIVHSLPYGDNSPACYSCHKAILAGTNWQHSPVANLLCEACHHQDEKIGLISVAKGKDSSLCYRCHLVKGKAWDRLPYVHQPVGFGVCAICHNPHGDTYRYQLWADGKADLCVSCHVDKEILLAKDTKGLIVHGIIKGSGCVACHDPHASENPFMLYKPINELCTGCHTELAGVTKGHPVGGHPVSGPHNPLRPERGEFNCASCHNPHGSRYAYMLVGDILGGHVCAQCHN